jgi:NADH-quinone oxidoreductase subunit M
MFSTLLLIVSLSSIGVPGTNGFVGEFLVLIGSYRTYPILSVIATTSVIIAAAYLLWAVQRILFNPLDKPENEHVPDLNRRELLLLAPLIIGIFVLGAYPAPVLRRMQPAAENFVRMVEARSAQASASAGDER